MQCTGCNAMKALQLMQYNGCNAMITHSVDKYHSKQ